jgi:hypothetical protein
MDEFTKSHLIAYAEAVCFDDEREEFIAYVEGLDDDDLAYYAESAGWPPALSAFRAGAVS